MTRQPEPTWGMGAKRQKKLYEEAPFEDPVMEKKRKDAILARENREMKKQEKVKLVQEIAELKAEIKMLREKETTVEERIAKVETAGENLLKVIGDMGMIKPLLDHMLSGESSDASHEFMSSSLFPKLLQLKKMDK